MTDRGRGYTLVELLVSLCLLVLVAAGLLRFLGACFGTLARVVERVELRRGLRRALDRVSDDVQEAGFHVPCRAPPGLPFLERGARGELVLIKDEVLHGQGWLCAPLPLEDAAPRARIVASARVRLRKGDVLLVEDGAWEGLRLEEPLDLTPRVPGEGAVTPLDGEARRGHGEGAPVSFLRPLRRVTYRLEGTSLVRRSGDPLEKEDVTVLADHLETFRVDLPRGEGGGIPIWAVVTLEARGPRGERCALTLARAPRNGP